MLRHLLHKNRNTLLFHRHSPHGASPKSCLTSSKTDRVYLFYHVYYYHVSCTFSIIVICPKRNTERCSLHGAGSLRKCTSPRELRAVGNTQQSILILTMQVHFFLDPAQKVRPHALSLSVLSRVDFQLENHDYRHRKTQVPVWVSHYPSGESTVVSHFSSFSKSDAGGPLAPASRPAIHLTVCQQFHAHTRAQAQQCKYKLYKK